ncbi:MULTISPECIES: SDR family oxidoreductase [unclassified Nostoc]|uniref:NAD-dependent epimerase/dehydratase family protein n=1 Tax=unclassified Nostoc TaxID=2593658 RepID=UPI0025AA7E66|nr:MULTISPECIES: SDR family oxidoreductase [unclassified Nostoc]MDM9580638.1 SDR family oxidoreductase [Nostoc sp. GT001]MDZ7945862.1 SDR family oxidoreductase [Nostoc sp. EfeVER01]MDZ7990627.1 SDR family oxidoreductase [Nostoc sp. EspVER01]
MTTFHQSVLVTGVAGFIGRYVARYFSEQGWSVIGVDNSPPENAPLHNLTVYHRLKLPDPSLNNLLKEYSPKVCIHCAGRASVGLSIVEPDIDFQSNTALTFAILNALRINAPRCRFIFLSSAAIYGNPESLPIGETQRCNPISPYGFHKLQSEQLCLEFSKVYDLPTASVRIFSAYGPGLRRQVLWDICRQAIYQPLVKLQGTGKESRDFIHVLDIAKALLVVATSAPMQGETYNFASGREVTISELAEMVFKSLDYKGSVEFDGIVPVGTPINWQADVTKLGSLGITDFLSLERGVRVYANWSYAELLGI